MKICIINNIYHPFKRGGAEKIAEISAQEFKNQGHQVFFITTWPVFKNKKNFTLKDKIYYLNSIFYYLDRIPKPLRFFWHFLDTLNINNFIKVKKILKKERPNLVITHNLKGIGFLTPHAIKSQKIKHIHTLHDIQLLHPSGLVFYGEEKALDSVIAKAYQKINKKLFSGVDLVVSPSKWLLEKHLVLNFFNNSKKLTQLNPITNIKGEKNLLEKSDRFIILFIGQIESHKGIQTLLKAFDLIENKKNYFELLMVGGGSMLEELNKNNKNSQIKYIGKKNSSEIYQLMKKAHCLVIPSHCYENSPTVIYEALINELPIIASRIGGNAELIHKFGGFLFNPKDEKDLCKKIMFLKDNYEKQKENSLNKKSAFQKSCRADNYIKKIISYSLMG